MLQSTALDVLKSGHNVFITGSAGAGKSYTLKLFLEYLKENNIQSSRIAITASTGIAATHLEGETIHSWSCIGIRDYMTDDEIYALVSKAYNRIQRIKDARILIIDEISMLHRRQIELLDRVLQAAMACSKPFGGIQIILVGDFFQLPPVVSSSTKEFNRDRFCFMSDSWVNADFKVCYLTEQHRNGSGPLNEVLNAIRDQDIQEKHYEILNSRLVEKSESSEILQLHTHNANVDLINFNFLKNIKGESRYFKAEITGNDQHVKALTKSVLAPRELELKVGAKVMFVKNNIDSGYANGSQGVVVRFVKDEEYDPPYLPVILVTATQKEVIAEPVIWEYELKAKVVASFSQIPLRLAWAITIHKSQGMTLDEAAIDLSSAFESSQGYVALSRLRDIQGLHILGLKSSALELNKLAVKADVRFRELSDELEGSILTKDKKTLEVAKKLNLKRLK